MLRIGLTGGIATGKSTVACILRELGCHVIEADKIAHRLIEPGTDTYKKVVNEFGPGILAADGRVERPRLAAIVFGDQTRLAKLNSIVHPPVLEAQDRELAEIGHAEPHAIGVVEAALLIEAGYHKALDYLIVTWCTPEQQLLRLTGGAGTADGRGLTVEQARQRIAAQMPIAEKRRMADFVIDCSGSLAFTREQVEALVAKLKNLESHRAG